MADAPDWIVGPEKKAELLKTCENSDQAKARIEGEFYTSSGLVLNNYQPEVNLLHWTLEELLEKFPDAKLYRAMDPGLDHPTTCAWGALLRTNQWVIYRVLSQRGLSISDRCKTIIELSGNIQIEKTEGGFKQVHEVMNTPKSEKIEATIADYHVFKTDEVTMLPVAHQYTLKGLPLLESTHKGPEDRAMSLNDALKVSNFYPCILTGKAPGPKIYFLSTGVGVLAAIAKWQDFYWERFRGGEMKGMPKDKIPSHGDDELDSVCYLESSSFVWTKYSRFGNLKSQSEVIIPPSDLARIASSRKGLRAYIPQAEQITAF
jgi:hypothetical protein